MQISALVSDTKVLKMGNSGADVAALQLALKNIGYPLTGTGYFGTSTDAAVTSFQKRLALVPDGDVGPTTARAIDAAQGVPLPSKIAEEVSRPLWLEAGLKYVGVKETIGSGDNKTIIDWAKAEGGDIAKTYTHDVIAWCALFVNMMFTKSDLKGTETLWALDWNAERMKKRLGHSWPGVRLLGPAVGAIAPMLRNGGGHVICIVGKDQDGNIMGLGGNQKDRVSIVPFPMSRLNEGLWWPASVPLPSRVGLSSLPVVRSDGKVSSNEA